MLVLTRKLNQQIRLGDDITITVLRVRGNTIRLGIEAPRSTRVVRGELPPLEEVESAADAGLPQVQTESPPHVSHTPLAPARHRATARINAAGTTAKPLAGFVADSMSAKTTPVMA